MSNVDNLLSRLDRVKQTRPGIWMDSVLPGARRQSTIPVDP